MTPPSRAPRDPGTNDPDPEPTEPDPEPEPTEPGKPSGTRRSRPRQQPRQDRGRRSREAILAAAVELIGEHGLPAVTHRKAAQRAGVAVSTVWYHFASIDDLAAEALRVYALRAMRDYLEAVDTMTGGDPAAEGILRAVAEVPFTEAAERAQITMYLESGRNANLREPVSKVADAYRRIALQLLARMGLPDPEDAAPAFVALFDGFTLWRLARPDQTEPPGQLERAITALALGYLIIDEPDTRAGMLSRLRPRPEVDPADALACCAAGNDPTDPTGTPGK